MGVLISLAKSTRTETIIHISDVDKSIVDTFHCVGCDQTLIPVKSKPRKKDWHFRHSIESSCNGNRDLALHRYAIQILLHNSEIVLTKDISITYSNARKEVGVFDYRSDVTVTSGQDDIHFEVFVTHDLSQEKVQMYQTNKIKCVRIDLSDKLLLRAEPEVIKTLVLKETKSKTLIFWKDLPEGKLPKIQNHSQYEKTISPTLTIGDIVIGILILLGIKYAWTKIQRLFQRKR